ncbi:AAA family ATPase [Streptomyces sp. NPDC006645]|uniref:AAA family ATPase n=1 Tax=unclassified Streptomyces TaxID=2593676 RepID=UPI0033B6D221
MRENTRAEVRDIAAATASETVMRYADALARSPYAQQTIESTAREVATETAREIAGERVADAAEIVRTAEKAAGDTADETARRVAEKTATTLTEEATAKTSERTRQSVEDALATAAAQWEEALGNAGREWEEALGKARREWEESREAVARSAGQFARDEAVRTVVATVADSVPPVVEVRVAQADPVRVGGHTHAVLPDVLLALGAGCHVLLVGPAGTGKSMMAQQAAQGFGQEFHALSLGPTTPMSKIFGYYDAHGHYHGTPFRSAFEHGGLMLLDELDSGHPGLLAELNQALSIRSCAFADGMVAAHPDFRLIATANTYGTGGDRQYVGRQALDAATLDRFVVIDVPVDEELEERIALAHAPARPVDARQMIEEVRRLRATGAEKRLPVMFSPRASIDAAKLLQAGASVEQALRWRVVRGMSAAHRSALGLGSEERDGLGAGEGEFGV